ncbi:hypothetical protein Enr13x_12710 [Stieleria neptunia]|uniref:Uncharacterized protein n=1 Tax=Stieleria neptunia TaxID=2527979 RepID=A0A518HKP7_9BACT|nr:hypothetical protein [Stieleria neptunia]QDV41432.1 hypothetical protein Enr13x_12710 [Stieleria neptunia]
MFVAFDTNLNPQPVVFLSHPAEIQQPVSLVTLIERYLDASGSADRRSNHSIAVLIAERTERVCGEQGDLIRTALRLAADQVASTGNRQVVPSPQCSVMQPAQPVRRAAPLRLSWWTGLILSYRFTASTSAGTR